jgi:asparaginyl-tRNA synthetase
MNIKRLLQIEKELTNVQVGGWIRSIRSHAKTTFINLSDGSSLQDLQVVTSNNAHISNGACVLVVGDYKRKPGNVGFELQGKDLQILGTVNSESYPLQKSRLPLEYIRKYGHLKSRTRIHQAMARIRSLAIQSISKVFNQSDFIQVHTPIITGSDAEGGGDVFQVVKKDFFSKPVYLTVSSQLHLEMMASGISRVYSLNPAFRAEESASTRHLAEFWMLEAEIAFLFDLNELLDFIQESLISITQELLESEDLRFFSQFVDPTRDERIQKFLQPWGRIDYTKAISVLKSAKRTWDYPVKWGAPLQTEHERYLAEEYVKGPVFVTDYPESVKPFYMKLSKDGKTVACTDLLVPKVGELIGGSLREECPDRLSQRMIQAKMNKEDYSWYLDLRKYGTAPHGGFGMGLERYLAYLTGSWNLKDWPVAPRYLGHCNY